ncbi:hypothetical protein OZX72_02850 [Bifidobacterium sp. ESL0769]|uniref:hypothetical protein n=1 Tax=Bifidobacterium sp. ESL0769 TaxID=2983229 RepID=UPI0023F9C13E|nr:hypothetical protein [Bifidobacterium sp. ESL0769]WEV67940.1 hypothetical protein OZX72_02850 [Bifidobacterium sp. ESL0769]
MNINWESTLSVVTALTAVLALGLSLFQIWLSNKQQLFTKRVDLWLKLDTLLKLYGSNRKSIRHEYEEGKAGTVLFANDLDFIFLTNSADFNAMAGAIHKPLDNEEQSYFLTELEEIRKTAVECEFLFKGELAKSFSAFVNSYVDVLFAMYQYQIVINRMEEDAQEKEYNLERALEENNEPQVRKGLVQKLRELDNCYELILKRRYVQKVRKKIRL